MSHGIYAPDKALWHGGRISALSRDESIYPAHLHLILTNTCNHSCPGCAYRLEGYTSNETFDESNRLPTELVTQVLRDCREMDTRAIEFTGGGEPTVHPDCGMLMAHAQDLGLQTALITNGTRLDKVEQEAVRGTWLRISLDAACEKTYEITHRNQMTNSWSRVLNNIERVVALKEKTNSQVNIGIGFVVQQANWTEILEGARLAWNLGVNNIRISALFTPEGPRYHAEYAEQAEQLALHTETIFRGTNFVVHNRLTEKLTDLSGPPNYARCYYQQFTTYLGADANLYRCCVQSYNPRGLLGNVVAAGGFKKLWDEIAANGSFERFDARGCQRCQFNDRNGSIAAGVRGEIKLDGPVAHPFFV